MSTRTFAVVGLAATLLSLWRFSPAPVENTGKAYEPQGEVLHGPTTNVVVDLVDGATAEQLAEVASVLGSSLSWAHPLAIDEALAVGVASEEQLARLSNHPLVEVAEPVIELTISSFPSDPPNDPLFEKQWHLRSMGAEAGWARTSAGRGIVVAVIDTGVARVPDLAGTKILKGATFVPRSTPVDDQGHGTHVAGTIAQSTNNGIGVAGVAPNATILPVKVLSKYGSGQSTWIAAGIDYAVDEGADVINMSLGGGYSAVIHNAVKKARQKGVIVVAAVGNSGRKGVSYPGGLKEAIGVSATGPDGKIAPYSSWGKGVDIAAPGGNKQLPGGGVWQDTIDGKGGHHYAEFQGTSMATPHVAGAAAVLLGEGLTPNAVERLLLSGSEVPDEKFGYGKLDLAAALTGFSSPFGAWLFGVGGLVAFLVSLIADTKLAFAAKTSAVSAVTAGGLFFLPLLGLSAGVLSRPMLEWFGGSWMNFPLVCSALLPFLAAFVLGAGRATRPLGAGISLGIGAHLLYGASVGGLSPWWMSEHYGALWLTANGLLAVLFGLGVASAQSLWEKNQ